MTPENMTAAKHMAGVMNEIIHPAYLTEKKAITAINILAVLHFFKSQN